MKTILKSKLDLANQGVASSQTRVAQSAKRVEEAAANLAEAQRQHTSAKAILQEWEGKVTAAAAQGG